MKSCKSLRKERFELGLSTRLYRKILVTKTTWSITWVLTFGGKPISTQSQPQLNPKEILYLFRSQSGAREVTVVPYVCNGTRFDEDAMFNDSLV